MTDHDRSRQRCANCKWWDGNPADPDIATARGDCRATPPHMGVSRLAVWPATNATDWCAHFRYRGSYDEAIAFEEDGE